MAVYWIRSSGGSDVYDGLSYATAWATLEKITTYLKASGVKGDVFNIVNDGTHTMPDGLPDEITRNVSGSDYMIDPAFVLRGCDQYGNAAATNVEASSSASGSYLLQLGQYCNYLRIENLFIDLSTANESSGSAGIARFQNNAAGPCLFQYSALRGWEDDDSNFGQSTRAIFTAAGNPSNWGEVRYCGLWNLAHPVFCDSSTAVCDLSIHHSVIRHVGRNTSYGSYGWRFSYYANALNDMEFYHNTLYYVISTDTVANILRAMETSTSGDGGTMNCHSNLLWFESSVAGSVLTAFFAGNSASTVTFDGTIGYNVLLFGPTVVPGDVVAIYQLPWATGGTPKSTDIVDYGVAASGVFNDPTSTYDWAMPNGVVIELPEDLRPTVYTTAGLGYSVPGALPGIDVEESGSEGEPTHNNLVLEYDFFTNTWTRHVFMADSTEVFGFNSFLELKRQDEISKLLGVCDSSGARQVETGAVQILGDCFYENATTNGISWSASTKYFDCDAPDIIKTFLSVVVRMKTPHDIYVSFDIDEGLQTGDLETISPTTHTWDETDLNWQGTPVEEEDFFWGGLRQGDVLLRFPQGMSGRRVSLTFSGEVLNEGTEIQGVTIRYKREPRDDL